MLDLYPLAKAAPVGNFQKPKEDAPRRPVSSAKSGFSDSEYGLYPTLFSPNRKQNVSCTKILSLAFRFRVHVQ